MAEDTVELLRQLNATEVFIIGHSDGAFSDWISRSTTPPW